MNEPPLDPERLAALLDGRLDARARDALLAELAQSEDARELLGDAAAILHELEAAALAAPVPAPAASLALPLTPTDTVVRDAVVGDSQPRPDVPPAAIPPAVTPPTRWRAPRWVGGALAAAFVGAVGLTAYQRATGPAFSDPAEVLRAMSTTAPTPGAPGWSVTRGGGDALSSRARAVRFGARVAELEVATRSHDTAAMRVSGAQIAQSVDGILMGGALIQIYRQAVDEAIAAPTSQSDEAASMRQLGYTTATDMLGAADVRAGTWLAAARIAAAARDTAFFRTRASRRSIDAIATRTDLDDELRAASARVRQSSNGVTDWPALARDLETLLGLLGS